MAKLLRWCLKSAVAITVVVILLASFAWWSIHTSWFANLVRTSIVAGLEKTTGGRIEIGSFSFNADTLHAKVSQLVIHGTEPAGSAPLLSVGNADIGIRILSVWRQKVDVNSIVIVRPEVHLLVKADGSTNVPLTAKQSNQGPLEQLLDLKVKRLEVSQGMLDVNDKKVPFSVQARDTSVLLNYNRANPSYALTLDVAEANSFLLWSKLRPMHILVKARLYRDHADIEDFQLISGGNSSTVQLAGRIEHFAQPSGHASVQAYLSIDELAQFATINEQLRGGRMKVAGVADFSAVSNQFLFKGNAEARGVAFVSPAFTLSDMSATAVVVANKDGMLLKNAHAAARGALFSGEGTIRNYQSLQVQGQVQQIGLREVGSYLTSQPFPWSGTAHGEAHASAKLGVPQPEFVIGAKVDIDPGNTDIPTGGNLEVTYYNQSGEVTFGDSRLNLPHTKLEFQGTLASDLLLKANSTDTSDLQSLIPILGAHFQPGDLPLFAPGGGGHFEGALHDLSHQAAIKGVIALNKFKFRDVSYNGVNAEFALSATEFSTTKFEAQQAGADLTGSGRIALSDWEASANSALHLRSNFKNLDVVNSMKLLNIASFPVIKGVASGSVNVDGQLNNLSGNGAAHLVNLDAFGETLNQADFTAALNGDRLELSKGKIQAGPAALNFSGSYQHGASGWSTGNIDLRADTNGFPLSSLATIRKYLPAVNGRAELHLEATGRVRSTSFEASKINGTAEVRRVSLNGRELGSIELAAVTQGKAINFKYSGDLQDTQFHGAAQAQLSAGTPISGEVQVDRISLAAAKALALEQNLTLPVNGFLEGSVAFDGPLEEPFRIHSRATVKELQVSSLARPATLTVPAVPAIVLRNREPIVLDMTNGTLNISKFEMTGRETSVKVTGSVPLQGDSPMDVSAVGNADLALFMLFDPNVRSSGSSELSAKVAGPLSAPTVTGTLKILNGSFFLMDVPNGLSDVEGTVLFSRNRATIQRMSAHSGGGDISLGGSLRFGEGSPLVYHLEAAARNVRVRYANSISVTANSDLRLSGTSARSLLSGTLTVTRVVFTPNTDAGNLLAAASSYNSSPSNPEDFIAGLHLDVAIESAPNLQVSTNLSRDLEAEIQLRLRGTPDHPTVLGSIAANQGDLKIFGSRFSLNRGEVSFVNAVRVEPILDLDLETQARGVTVDITVSGTPSKLNFNYRSDPPLQPRDIIALLTVGRAPNTGGITTSNAQGASDVSALTSGVNSVLGSAISPVSNRLSKLFGVTNIRIDPFVQGITNTPQARLSVEQQISRDVTVTYITNLSQTSEQIFRFEWSLNRQFSVVAIRDDNGEFGIDFQYKKRFK